MFVLIVVILVLCQLKLKCYQFSLYYGNSCENESLNDPQGPLLVTSKPRHLPQSFLFSIFSFFWFLIIINNTREKNLTMVIAKSIVPIFWYKLKTRVSTHQLKGAYLKRSPKNGCKVFVTVFFTRKCPDVPYIPELLV